MKRYNQEEYKKAVEAWRKTRIEADKVMEKITGHPGKPVSVIKEEDVKIIRANNKAWEKVLEIARRPK